MEKLVAQNVGLKDGPKLKKRTRQAIAHANQGGAAALSVRTRFERSVTIKKRPKRARERANGITWKKKQVLDSVDPRLVRLPLNAIPV